MYVAWNEVISVLSYLVDGCCMSLSLVFSFFFFFCFFGSWSRACFCGGGHFSAYLGSISLSLSLTSYELTRTWGVIHEALVFLVFELGLSVRVFRNGDEVGLACHGGTRGAA